MLQILKQEWQYRNCDHQPIIVQLNLELKSTRLFQRENRVCNFSNRGEVGDELHYCMVQRNNFIQNLNLKISSFQFLEKSLYFSYMVLMADRSIITIS